MRLTAASNLDRSGRYVWRGSVKPMSKRDIINAMRKRRYAWGKSAQELSDEIGGISADQIRSVILGNDFSDAIAAKLVTWLKRPIPGTGLVSNRTKNDGIDSVRSRLIRKIGALAILGRQYAIIARKQEYLKAMKVAELRVYYWKLDRRVKQAICDKYDVGLKFLLPDHHEAWEWVERLDRLSQHRETSSMLPGSLTRRKIG